MRLTRVVGAGSGTAGRRMAACLFMRRASAAGPGAAPAIEERSCYRITEDVEFDVAVRQVDEFPSPEIPGYTALDVRLAWHVTDRTGAADERGEIPRGVHVGARWRF